MEKVYSLKLNILLFRSKGSFRQKRKSSRVKSYCTYVPNLKEKNINLRDLSLDRI